MFPQDRYAGLSGGGGYRGGLRGGLRGSGFSGRGFRGGFRGGYRGGFGGHAGPGHDFSNQDLYADYTGPDQHSGPGHGGMRIDGYGSGSYGAHNYGGPGYVEPKPSQQIMVRNVSADDLGIFFKYCSYVHAYSYHGPRRMKTWLNSSRPRVRLNWLKSFLMARGRKAVALFSLLRFLKQKRP
jgi:hypothetical protein